MFTPQDFTFKNVLAGLQMLFVAFGALVLMPLIAGLEPSVALFTAGIGTLAFHFITKKTVPIFLASSFAFIAPISYSVQTFGMAQTMGALFAAGVVYMILAVIVKIRGSQFLERILPPVVVAPIIMVIGLSLAPVAVNMAMGKTGDGAAELFAYDQALLVSMVSLLTTLVVATLGKGLFRLVPIISGVVVGYTLSYALGMVDTQTVSDASWFAMPKFVAPEFSLAAQFYL